MAPVEPAFDTFTPYEMEFFAEDELVTIVPTFSLPAAANSTLTCFAVGGSQG